MKKNIFFNELAQCSICPRNCKADRYSNKLGYCRSDAGFNIASICNHRGEEPLISGSFGICNVFFAKCNMQCVYCQNYQISSNNCNLSCDKRDLEEIAATIIRILDESKSNMLGFVSPSHCIPQMKIIINELNQSGYHPTIVYNSNGYDKKESIEDMEEYIDVYLPDLKYIDEKTSLKYSGCGDYFKHAKKAIKEMYRQKGALVRISDNGYAENGLIIRHLVIPGLVQNSLDIIRFIAEEISTNIHLSLMSQYYPPRPLNDYPEIDRTLYEREYMQVLEELDKYGFSNGWIQELSSSYNYRPEFEHEHPFE